MTTDKRAKPLKKVGDLVSQEIAFAKVLSGNDTSLRDKALHKLKRWLSARAVGSCVFNEDDFTRVWTGLFYSMWMSDKYLVQEKLAESLSELIHCFEAQQETTLLFIGGFHKIMVKEWPGLDQHRLDKFCMLLRRFVRHSFMFCKKNDWNLDLCKNLIETYNSTVLNCPGSLGYFFQFTTVYLEELAKVSEGTLETQVFVAFIEPFVKIVARTTDPRVRSDMRQLFVHLINQTDVGLSYAEKLRSWTSQGCPGRGPHEMELVKIGDDEEQSNEEEEEEEEKPWDPRAGGVNVMLPQLPVQGKAFTQLFQSFLHCPKSTVKGKKMLLTLIKQFQELDKGKYPMPIKKEIIPFNSKGFTSKSAKKLMKFKEKLMKKKVPKKSHRESSDNEEDEEEDDDDADDNEPVEGASQNSVMKKDGSGDEEEMEDEPSTKDEESDHEEIKTREDKARKEKSVKKVVRNTNMNGFTKSHTEDVSEAEELQLTPQGAANVKIATPVKQIKPAFTVENVSNKDLFTPPGGRKRRISGDWLVDEVTADNEGNALSVPKIIKLEKPVEEDPWQEPLKEGEVEIFVPNKKYLTRRRSEGPAFWANAKAKTTPTSKRKSLNANFRNPYSEKEREVALPSTPSRRISFALNRNMEQEAEEYVKGVRNSPQIPFDSSKKPKQSSLKPGLSPSPINPFYRLHKKKP